MKGFRALALFPIVFGILAGGVLLASPASARETVMHALIEVEKAVALFGLAAAALAFERGDYLRRGWGLLAGCYVCILARDGWLILAPDAPSLGVELGRAALLAVGNGCLVLGSWTLARAWSVAGLELPGSRTARFAITGAAIIFAALCAGSSLVVDIALVASGKNRAFFAIPSDLGDLLSLPLIAPVALTAFAVRGGSLRWPWTLLAASLASWIVYDAILTVPEIFHLGGADRFRVAAEQFRFLAGSTACAAGLAQRRAVRS